MCDCGGLLRLVIAPPAVDAGALRQQFTARRTSADPLDISGVWRYRELVLPEPGPVVVTHPEGNTPLLRRDSVAAWAGAGSLLMKHEGHNPTGSFKDRGMTVAMTQAIRTGARAVACASTGNTAASLAAYAAQAGVAALVLVPAGGVAPGKVRQAAAYGARVVAVEGDFDDCLRLLREAAEPLGIYLLNSINPFRVAGQQAIVFELLDQLGWDPPDWIALPAGNLGNTSAFGQALAAARAAGLIDHLPRLAAIQAEGAAPFARGFREGFTHRHTVRADTVATAIRIGNPASWDRAVDSIRATQGTVTSVTDDEILAAKHVVDRCGVGCEPASAASIAGVRRLVAEGVIAKGESVVAVLTGHLLKDPGEPPPAAGPIPPTVEALAEMVETARS
jgi:threonine synthase